LLMNPKTMFPGIINLICHIIKLFHQML
jgi:hypothetical protein